MNTVIPGKRKQQFVHLVIYHLIIVLAAFIFSVRSANSYMYGEEQPTRQLIVDKRVRTSTVGDWQDNLPASQVVLKEGEMIEFEITVKNSGDQELNQIQLVDYLPSYLNFIFGPNQPNDQKEVNWVIDQLAPGEEQRFRIRAQISGSDSVVNEGTFCLLNRVRAEAETGEADEDTASFCIVGAKKLPQAGSQNLAVGTLIASLIGAVGITLRKFGRGEILA